MKVIKNDELEKEGLRLMHAVGRASINKPRMVNLCYNGNAQNTNWLAFVGKGLCFDSGGLNIKVASTQIE
jgi:leucyl aminopeptidase